MATTVAEHDTGIFVCHQTLTALRQQRYSALPGLASWIGPRIDRPQLRSVNGMGQTETAVARLVTALVHLAGGAALRLDLTIFGRISAETDSSNRAGPLWAPSARNGSSDHVAAA